MSSHDTSLGNTDHVSWVLAQWASALTWESLGDEAIRAAKLFLFDSFGCALGGSCQEDVAIMRSHAEAMGANGPCTVFGSTLRADPVTAGLLNALCIRAMDYNDIYWKADPAHPSDIIPAALSICEMQSLSGKDLVLGTIIAYEIEMRLAEFGCPGIREYGWHHATLTSIAAPIVAGRMLGLPPEQIQQAVGISASPSMCLGAVTAGKLTNMKNTVDPMATRAGIEAALLASRGYTGPEHLIDGKEGLVHCFEKFGGTFDLDLLAVDLPSSPSDRYRICECGMKSYPIEALSHAPLTAMMRIAEAHDFRPEDVEEIRVEVIARAADILGDPAKYRPTSRETADHSLPYSLAVGLVDGMVTPLQFTQERIDDESLHAVMDMVQVVPSEEFESLFPEFQPSQVTITLSGGDSWTQRVDVPKGDPRDPMTEEEIATKFRALGEGVIGSEDCGKVQSLLMDIDQQETLGEVLALMTTG